MVYMLISCFLSSGVFFVSINGHVGLKSFGSQTPSIPAAVGVPAQDCISVFKAVVSNELIYEQLLGS